MTYQWTKEEIAAMKSGTPLLLTYRDSDRPIKPRDIVIYDAERSAEHHLDYSYHRDAHGGLCSAPWDWMEPLATSLAPSLSEQDRDMFERRSEEVAQLRRALNEKREAYDVLTRALSRVLSDRDAFEQRAVAAEETLATLRDNADECALCNSSWDAQERAEQYAFDARERVRHLEQDNSRLARDLRQARQLIRTAQAQATEEGNV